MQYGEKAYMIPRDDMSWKLYVDQWLHLSTATGEYAQIASQWLGVIK
jgi:cyclohexadienyl dehydratase (EC 4.2.1.91)